MTPHPSETPDAGARGNVADLLTRAAAAHPGRPALIGSSGVRTWLEVDAAVDVGVRNLVAVGLRRGDRVVVSLRTGANIVAALFAVARAGLVAVPLEPARGDLTEIIARVGASAVISDQPSLGALTWLRSDDVETWWRPEAASGPDLSETSDHADDLAAGGEDLALLVRLTGTGHPVMVSHRAVLAAVTAIVAAPRLALRAEDRALLVLPLYHLAGWVTAFLPLSVAGAAAVVPDLPEQGGQWIESVLSAVRRHRVTIIPAAPSLYRRFRDAPNVERSLASVRLMTSGASSLEPEDFAAVHTRTGQSVWEGYGISEATSAVASSLMTVSPRPGSVGLPLPGIEVRIVGDDDPDDGDDGSGSGSDGEEPAAARVTRTVDADIVADVSGAGEVGLIAIRGATLFSGYWPDGQGGPDEQGWFVTGDVGYLDDSSELHLVDRAAEFVTVAGFTVYPREVEDVLGTHPYVRDAAVIGVPGRAGEAVIAVLVAQRGTHPTPQDLDDFVGSRLPIFKRPTRYRLVERLPRTELGRVDRHAVRRNYLADPDPGFGPPVRLAVPAVGESGGAGAAAAAPTPARSRPPRAAATTVGADGEEDLF